MTNFGIRCKCLNLKAIHPRCITNDYVSRDSAVTQYSQATGLGLFQAIIRPYLFENYQ
jgi:hypothetical protein